MTSAAPGWVTYLSLLISGGALWIAYLSFRAGGPRLILTSVLFSPDSTSVAFPNGRASRLTVTNGGRAAITVKSFNVTPYGGRKPVLAIPADSVSGPTLPYRLDAHDSADWIVDVLEVARLYDNALRAGKFKPFSSWPNNFHFTAVAGNGNRVKAKTVTDALRIIADAQNS